jgi:hypothetical protein
MSIFLMDTIAKAENVAMALGLSSLLAIWTKDFNPLSLEKKRVRGFEYFSKLLYVAAVNKSSSFKSHWKWNNKCIWAFRLHKNVGYNDIRDALTVLGSMFNVDSHKSITVGGVKTGATSTPNRDSSMSQQISRTTTLIQKYTRERFLILSWKS